jgi:hypothetical protein
MTGNLPSGTPEQWRYIGRREVGGGGLADAWLNGTGERLLFKGRRGAVGSTYEVLVDRTGEHVSMVGVPRFQRPPSDSEREETATWAAEDRAAYTNDELRKAEGRAKRDDGFGDLTLDQARCLIRARPLQATALLAQIIRYVSR